LEDVTMASLGNDANGCRRILFYDAEGARKTIWLGKMSKRDVESIKFRVEGLLTAKITGALDRDLSLWVAGLDAPSMDPTLRGKLERAGLLVASELISATLLGLFIDSFLDGRADLKPSTMLVRNQVRALLCEHFGEDRDVTAITPGDADGFQQWLVRRKMAPATISKRVQVAKSYFRAMLRPEKITRNPFDGVRATAASNADRMQFLTVSEINAVIEKCPDHHWRCIVALARFGGLRTPSETRSLRWQDIDWATGRMVVTSPKREHHAEGHRRVVPIFPELRPFLEESFDLAPEGAVYVVNERFREAAQGPGGWASANLRTTFTKIVKRAGLNPWPKLFQNLRASRETELCERFPIQVVTSWLGNSPKVAMKHYLMTTEEHFARAVADDKPDADKQAAQNAPHQVPKVAQNAAPQAAAPRTHGDEESPANHVENVAFTGLFMDTKVAETGLEPVTPGL